MPNVRGGKPYVLTGWCSCCSDVVQGCGGWLYCRYWESATSWEIPFCWILCTCRNL